MLQQESHFENIYQKLNENQKKAVDAIEGTVMVVAGPGTGKTEILAARIAKILLETDAQANNILCLTFTDAGATAMRNRLLSFIGPQAHHVHIHTFHSFCNKVIQENKDLFDNIDWQPVSELEKFEILKSCHDNLPNTSNLKRFKGRIYNDISSILKLYDLMKKEGYTVDYLIQKIEAYLAVLPQNPDFIYQRNGKGFNKGDVKANAIKLAEAKMEKLKEAVLLFDVYQQAVSETERYDFYDMLLWVTEKFEKHPELLLNYQENLLYFLADEFQDTNATQYHLLKLLAGGQQPPNLFVVGDDDQTIYRFQGAEMDNIADFQTAFDTSVQTIVLEENYRSTQVILDTAATLIKQNSERLVNYIPGLTKNLKAKASHAALANKPQLVKVFNEISETVYTARQIQNLINSGNQPGDIAVLYRKNKYAENLLNYLKARNIPVWERRRIDVLKTDEIASLIKLLEYLNTEAEHPNEGDGLLFQILHLPMFNLSVLDLALLANRSRRDRISLREYLQKDNTPLQQINQIRAVVNLINEAIRTALNGSAVLLIDFILNKMGMFDYLYQQPDRKIRLENITAFYDFVKQEAARRKNISLSELLLTLQEMTEYNIAIPSSSVYSAGNAVQFYTAHGSKGLQFKHVFILGCTENEWEKDPGLRYYSGVSDLFPHLKDENIIEENRRLFYVAVTRAMESVTFLFPENKVDGKTNNPSRYLSEIEQSGLLDTKEEMIEDDDVSELLKQLHTQKTAPVIEIIDKEIVEQTLQNYSLSVTHLNTYLKCPLSFYFNYIVQAPAGKNSYMAYGSAIHRTLEIIFREKISAAQKPDNEFIRQTFNREIYRESASFNKADIDRLKELTELNFPRYIEARIDKWMDGYYTYRSEVDIKTSYNNIPINGKLDNVGIHEGMVCVTDFKTGKFDNARPKLKGPKKDDEDQNKANTFEDIYGGDYWRQIMFYRILTENYSEPWRMESGIIDFVEPDANDLFQQIEFYVTKEQTDLVKHQIETTYHAIKNHAFTIGCNDADCQWCNFVRKNYPGYRLNAVDANN